MRITPSALCIWLLRVLSMLLTTSPPAPQVRIGGDVYPEIKEPDYLTADGDYRIDASAPQNMLRSLMYRLSYYGFAEKTGIMYGPQHRGYDKVRQTVIGRLNVELKYFEEVFTSENWLMRIYRVRPEPNRAAVKRGGRRTGSSSSGNGRKASSAAR